MLFVCQVDSWAIIDKANKELVEVARQTEPSVLLGVHWNSVSAG